MKWMKAAALAAGLAALAACATAPAGIGQAFRAPNANASILIMEPDVEVTFVTTSGNEQRADWAEQAEANLMAALQAELAASGETVALFDASAEAAPDVQQALLLNEAVSSALSSHVVMLSPLMFAGRLPHQADQRETYTLGESVRQLAPDSTADYALFLTSRTRIESGGVFMTQMLIGVATGYVPASTAFRGTTISLVDMRTGEVVWLGGINTGDPRNAEEAAAQIRQILRDGPLAPPAS